MVIELKWKDDATKVYASDFWYDLIEGGYIKPEALLDSESAKKVIEAVEILRKFRDEGSKLNYFPEC